MYMHDKSENPMHITSLKQLIFNVSFLSFVFISDV